MQIIFTPQIKQGVSNNTIRIIGCYCISLNENAKGGVEYTEITDYGMTHMQTKHL